MLLLSLLLTGCTYIDNDEKYGLASGNYNLTTEVVYQKEGYVPKYAYQIDRTIWYSFKVIIGDIGIPITEETNSLLRTDGVFEEPIFLDGTELEKELFSNLSKGEIEEIKEKEWEMASIEKEDAKYYLVAGDRRNPVYRNQYRLYKVMKDSKVISKEIELSSDKDNDFWTEMFAMYEGNLLCLYDTFWFDEKLELVQLTPIDFDDYLLEEKTIVQIMIGSGNEALQMLAEDFGAIEKEGRVGDMYYCMWEHTGKYYLMEIDVTGEILSVREISGMTGETVINKLTPKLYNPEDDKYYDVVR